MNTFYFDENYNYSFFYMERKQLFVITDLKNNNRINLLNIQIFLQK